MKNLLTLLLILFIIGILWVGSKFWEFSEDKFINPAVVEKSVLVSEGLDLEFLKKEFEPAYEF